MRNCSQGPQPFAAVVLQRLRLLRCDCRDMHLVLLPRGCRHARLPRQQLCFALLQQAALLSCKRGGSSQEALSTHRQEPTHGQAPGPGCMCLATLLVLAMRDPHRTDAPCKEPQALARARIFRVSLPGTCMRRSPRHAGSCQSWRGLTTTACLPAMCMRRSPQHARWALSVGYHKRRRGSHLCGALLGHLSAQVAAEGRLRGCLSPQRVPPGGRRLSIMALLRVALCQRLLACLAPS